MTWRRLRPGDLDHEALWLGVSLSSLALAWLWLHLGLPRPACPFHALTGCPCPTCGATRCVALALDGSFGAAFLINPLISTAIVGVAVFDLYALVVLAARLPRCRFDTISRPVRGAAAGAFLLNWAWLVWTGV
ncbi:MAG: hypothetical protein QOE70_478 [Chthoniobacter sp.]|jgi:hypothetical protein|nr:hypothetical protein [Chthoniobacter sp.]